MAPTNTSCASAEELKGCGGSVAASNVGWAGVWPVGGDPLFNLLGEGGGAPLWYRWTNITRYPLLFRVSFAASVRYNFAFITGSACGSLTAIDDTLYGATTENGTSASDFNPAFGGDFDEVVQPGDTIWFEIDSYDGDVTEPPNATAHLGNLAFTWSALTITQYDAIEGARETLPTDLLATGFSGGTPPFTPYDVLRLDDQLFFIWTYQDTYGETLCVADCALDGSGMTVVKLSDGGNPVHEWRANIWGPPQLRTDGTYVYVGYPYLQTYPLGQQLNPDYNPDTHGYTPFVTFDCTDFTNEQFHYRVHRYSAGVWSLLAEIGADNVTAGGGFFWDCDPGNRLPSHYEAKMTADPSQPGKVWIHASYLVSRLYTSLHHNNYPIGVVPDGSLWCTTDVWQLEDHVETYLIDGGVCSKYASQVGTPIVYAEWDHDDPNVNPIFGQWQWFNDGPWITQPHGNFPMIGHWTFWLVNDVGYPLMFSCAMLTDDDADGPINSNYIDITRIDTGAVIQSIPFTDFTFGTVVDPNAAIAPTPFYPYHLVASERFYNSETSRYQRTIGTRWTTTAVAKDWLVRIADDGTGGLTEIAPVDGAVSSRSIPFQIITPDNPRDWWTLVSYYDRLCGNGWTDGYDAFNGADHLGSNYAVSTRPYFDDTANEFYFMVGNGDLRRASLLYDFWICAVGPPCGQQPVFRTRHKAHA